MIFTECPSQKDILWCPEMNFCMILYESYKTSDEVKPLAISMLTNHQSEPRKKTECPSQKYILWCPKMNFCVILYESYKTSDEVKPLAISMLTNHQSDPRKKNLCEL